MPTLPSKLNPRSEDFKASAGAMRALVDDLNAKLAFVAQGGGEAARAKHVARVIDHAGIYLLIAGSYTPFTLIALRGACQFGVTASATAVLQQHPDEEAAVPLDSGPQCPKIGRAHV